MRLHRLSLLGVFVALVVALAVPAPASASYPGTNGRVAFNSSRNPSGIWVMDADGSNASPVLAGAFSASMSADGSKVAASKQTGGTAATEEIFVANTDGSGVVQVTSNSTRDFQPALSPDGTKVAFVGLADSSQGEIYTMNVDGTGLTRLTDNTVIDEAPRWSPDGSRIAWDQRGSNAVLKVMDADGSNVVTVTNSIYTDGYPDWSPDGTKLAFQSTRGGGLNYDIWVVGVDGSNLTRLTTDTAGDYHPSWAPDGTKIMWDSTQGGLPGLWAMNADGTGKVQVSSPSNVETSPSWAPGPAAPTNHPPVAQDDSVAVDEDGSVPVTLAATDEDGDPLTYAVVDQPAHGSLTGTAPDLTYAPAPDFNGSDSFTFRADDGHDPSNLATVSVTVTPVPDPPVANPASFSTPEATPLDLTLPGTDADGDPLTYAITSPPGLGTLSGGTGAQRTYTPGPATGSDSFTYTVSDGTTTSAPATVTVDVVAVNDPPTATSYAVLTPEDTPIDLLLGGFDPDGDPITFSVTAPPSHGSLGGTAPAVTYTPDANFNGTDSFGYVVNDGTFDSSEATVTVAVGAVNDPPTAQDQTVGVVQDGSVAVTLTGTDPDSDPLAYTLVALPAHGVVSGTPPNLTYEPDAGYVGPDSFTFTVADPFTASPEATVSIDVADGNDPPVADDVPVRTYEDVAAAMTLTGSDPDGDALSFAVATPPAHGTLSGLAPDLTYTPDADFNGQDTFTYTANDGMVPSSPATVTIAVSPVNDAPVATPQTVTVDEDSLAAITLGGTDIDGDPLTVTNVSSPLHGVLQGTAPDLVYVPDPDYFGTDSFTFRVRDGLLASDKATVSIVVAPTPDPPTAIGRRVVTYEDKPAAVVLQGSDPDGGPLTYQIASSPGHGTVTGSGANRTYVPDPDYNGTDSFQFTVSDGTTTSAPATVDVEIVPVNDAPVAVSQVVPVLEDSPAAVTLTGTDVEGMPLSFELKSQPRHGTLSGATPNLTYTPDPDFFGADWFYFKVADGSGGVSTGRVDLAVANVDDLPIGADGQFTVGEDKSLTYRLPGSDVDRDPLTFTVVADPTHGALTGTGSSRTYKPAPNYFGPDSFQWTLSDGHTTVGPFTVTITVYSRNDPPVATPQTVTTDEDTPVSVTLGATDVEGDPLRYTLASLPSKGVLTGTPPNLTYTPDPDANGTDKFYFRASDPQSTSSNVLVTVVVNPVNDRPVANSRGLSTPEDTPANFSLTGTDVDRDPLTFTVTGGPSHGTLTGTPPKLVYTPDPNYNGEDEITFTADDGSGPSDPGTVMIHVAQVNDPPVAGDLSVTTDEDTAVPVVLPATDADNDPLTYYVNVPRKGVLTGTPPNLTYTPDPNTNGTETFTYYVKDGSLSSPSGTVTIQVNPVNDAPVAHDVTASTLEDTAVAVTLTASDVENDALTWDVNLTGPLHGALSGTAPNLTFTPDPDWNGTTSFEVVASDASDSSAPATVTIVVTPVNDPPVALAGSLVLDEDTSAPLPLAGTDVDGDELVYAVWSGPSHGVLTGSAPSMTYVPDPDFHGTDTVFYRVFDGTEYSPVAAVDITVDPVNDAPVARPLDLSTKEDTALGVALSGTDVDGDPLSFSVATPPQHGSLSGTAPNLTYTPAADYNGADSFTYVADDGTVDSAPATVQLTVTPVNDPPAATPLALATPEDTAKGVTLSGTDPDGDSVTCAPTSPPAHGTLSGVAPSLTYTPDPDFNGTDSFGLRCNDGVVDSPVATVALTVTPVNDAPVLSSDLTRTINEDATAVVSFGSVASDADGDTLTASVTSGPTHGTVSTSGLVVTYTPAANWHGTDTMSVRIFDGTTYSATRTLTVVVASVNDPPKITGFSTYIRDEGYDLDRGYVEIHDPDGEFPYPDDIKVVRVDWGDGTVTHPSHDESWYCDGCTDVALHHVYKRFGNYQVKVTVADKAGAQDSAARVVKVTDRPIYASNFSNGWTHVGSVWIGPGNQAFSVSCIVDYNPYGKASDLTAKIHWGDGTTSTGTVRAASSVGANCKKYGYDFEVAGTHTWHSTGTKKITTVVTSKGGSTGTGVNTTFKVV